MMLLSSKDAAGDDEVPSRILHQARRTVGGELSLEMMGGCTLLGQVAESRLKLFDELVENGLHAGFP